MFDQGGNEPDYSPGGYSGGDNYSPSPFSGFQAPQLSFEAPQNMGRMIKLGILLIIVLAIAFIAFTIISSQRTITITLVDQNGDPVNGTLSIRDKSNNIIAAKNLGNGTFSVILWPGEYTLTGNATQFKSTTKEITVNADSQTTVRMNLIRDLSVTLEPKLVNSGNEIYEGQKIEGQLIITNTGNPFSANDIDVNTTSPLVVTINKNDIGAITQGYTGAIDFNVSVKSGTNLKTSTKASITFTIKGSTIKKTLEVTAMPTVSSQKISITGITPNLGLTAGTQIPIKITIQNQDTTLPVKNLIVRIIPTGDNNKNLSWLKFNQVDQTDKTTIIIESIDPRGKVEIQLFVEPPITAIVDDEFTGILSIESTTINRPITQNLQYKVSKAKTAKVELGGTTSYPINCRTTTNTCETKTTTATDLFLQNIGNVDITNIRVTLNTATDDGLLCFRWLGTDANLAVIPTLKAPTTSSTDSKEGLILNITPYYDDIYLNGQKTPTKTIYICDIKWAYLNPLTQSVDSDHKQINLQIRTTTN